MNNESSIDNVKGKTIKIIEELQKSSNEKKVNLANLSPKLISNGINYKELGFPKLKQFLEQYKDVLDFEECHLQESTPPVSYVSIKPGGSVSPDKSSSSPNDTGKYPKEDTNLLDWASFPGYNGRLEKLSEQALEEKWYYGDTPSNKDDPFPILKKYLNYTFKRLCFEDKILYAKDEQRNEEYAAFNTGLVDRNYEYIYALFKKNTKYLTPYWYIIDFVVRGEDAGKTLTNLFKPCAKDKADYFEDNIENMLYDVTKDLNPDYEHILTEHCERLPIEFLKINCPREFLCIDGINLDEIYSCDKEQYREYYLKLGQNIKKDQIIYRNLRNRFNDAIDLAKKRVSWNYRTAVPMYYHPHKKVAFLLPLSLINESHVDVALVAEKVQSGSYSGHTILPLPWAYSNSRLVIKPENDWLDTVNLISPDAEEDELL